MNTTLTILIHGFNKGSRDMAFLEKGLQKSGFETFSVDLPTRFGTMEQCREALDRQITGRIRKYQVVYYVAHSMGGLITRDYLSRIQQDKVGKCVFIATPHHGSRLAGIAGRIPFFSRIFKTVDPSIRCMTHLPWKPISPRLRFTKMTSGER